MTQDKCTIQDAARTLHIDRRKIYRMIDKGLISKLSEDGKTFVLMEELRAICAEYAQERSQESAERTEMSAQERLHYMVDKEHYEGLLIKLGQMEAEKRYLLEYKAGIEAKDKELDEARATITKARNELQRLIEYKQDSEQKAKALLDQSALIEQKNKEIEELKAKLKRPWFLRWFK